MSNYFTLYYDDDAEYGVLTQKDYHVSFDDAYNSHKSEAHTGWYTIALDGKGWEVFDESYTPGYYIERSPLDTFRVRSTNPTLREYIDDHCRGEYYGG